MLKVNNVRAYFLSAFLLLSAASCKKTSVYKALSHDCVASRMLSNIDSLNKAAVKVYSNPEYKFIGKDTVKATSELMFFPKRFMDKQNNALTAKFEDKVQGKGKFDYIATPDGDAYIYTHEILDRYSDRVTIIRNNDIYTTDSTDIYVPVEQWGRENLEAKQYLEKQNDTTTYFRRFLRSLGLGKSSK